MAPAGSASAIVGKTVEGHHVLHIEGYTSTKVGFATGKSIESLRFKVGRYTWHIEYWPNGKTPSYAEYISIVLVLDDTGFVYFPARVRFSLLDRAGRPVDVHTRTTIPCMFSDARRWYGFEDFIKRELLEKSEHLKDDCFKIRCDVIIPAGITTEDRPGGPALTPVPVPPSDLSRHLGDLLEDKDGADVTFRVAGETFRAHRCVLAARSPVFKAQFFGAMKESATAATNKTGAAEELVISVDDMEPEAFGALLSFLYTDALPDFPPDGKQAGQQSSVMNQHLLVAADKYNLERLKLICEENLCKDIETSTAATILALAEQHDCPRLKTACTQFLSSPAALSAMLETDDGFEYLVRSCPSVLKALISNISSSTTTRG